MGITGVKRVGKKEREESKRERGKQKRERVCKKGGVTEGEEKEEEANADGKRVKG
jgi:hypothetical protein